MTTSDDAILRMIPESTPAAAERADVLSALGLLDRLVARGGGKLTRALLYTLLRSIEVALLGDARLVLISRYWEAYAGRHHDVVATRLRELLGMAPPDSLVQYVVNCLGSIPARHGYDGEVTSTMEVDVLERQFRASRTKELRCVCCGYHFREEDVGEWRRETARGMGFRFATAIHPRRKADPLKPCGYPNSARSPLELQVDHVTPQLGFGWTMPDNLRVVCQFCNGGKLAYRRTLEPLSTSVAGCLGERSKGGGHSLWRQIMVVAAIGGSAGVCEETGKTADEVELTCVPEPLLNYDQITLLPWNVRCLCYDALPGKP